MLRNSLRISLVVGAYTMLLPTPALGQISSWTNAAGGLWSVPTNWDTPPIAGGSATTQLAFGLSASYSATHDLFANYILNSMLFSNSTATTVTIPSSGGSSLSFTGSSPFISMTGAGNAVISSPIAFNSDLTLTGTTGSGDLTLTGPITNASGLNNLIRTHSGTTAGDVSLSGGGSFRQFSLRAGDTNINGGTWALTAPTEGEVTAGLQLGQAAGQTASLTATGPSIVINVSENTYIGDIAGSTGTMNVSNGAVVNSGTGAGVLSGRLALGNMGSGALNITNGGLVNTSRFISARLAGSSGTILVDGPGSQFNAVTSAVESSGQLTVGNQGVGTMTISNGGVVTAANCVIGNRGLTATTGVGDGTLTVTGIGSRLILGGAQAQNSAGQLVVGWGSPSSTGTTMGRLDVLNGGQVFVNIAPGSPSTGNFFSVLASNVVGVTNDSGSGSVLQIANQMQLGQVEFPAGSATVNVGGGGVIQVGDVTFIASGSGVNINAGGTFRTGQLANFSTSPGVAGNIVTETGGRLEIVGSGFTAAYPGVISGGGSLIRSGSGVQNLSGINTYSGGTIINGGGVCVTGQIGGPVTVNSGGSLIGRLGTVAGSVLINSGGSLGSGFQPTANSQGVLTITGAITMNSGAALVSDIRGNTPGSGNSNHDQISLIGGGSLALGDGAANLTARANTNALTPADMIVIVNGGAVSGFFMNLPNGTQFSIPNAAGMPGVNDFYLTTIMYNPTSIVLSNFMPVPEPVHVLAVAGLAAAGFGRRRRNKK